MTPQPTAEEVKEVLAALKNRTLDDVVNEWSSELESQVRFFSSSAEAVARADSQVRENAGRIERMASELSAVRAAQDELDRSIELVLASQRESHTYLAALEADVERLAARRGTPSKAARDRDAAYALAGDIAVQLDNMSSSIEELVGKVNASRATRALAGAGGPTDTQALTTVLNAHLHALNWVGDTTDSLAERLDQIDEALVKAKAKK